MRHRYAYILALLLYIPLSSKAQNAPLQFVANKGQWNAPFLFKAASSDVDVYLEKAGFTYVVGAHDNNELAHAYKHGELKTAPTLRYHAYKVHLLGAKENPRVTTAKALPHYHNYYLGQDPTRWQSGIYPCLNVDYHNIYSGIDLHISSENQQLKYDFIVKPGADPTDIVLAYEGVDGMKLRNGNLEITTSVGIIKELKPYVYQYIDNQKVEVPCN